MKRKLFPQIFAMALILILAAAAGAADLPKGWSKGGQYESTINGVWDSSVLPTCVPPSPAGVKVDYTAYKSKEQKTMGGSNSVGRMDFPDSRFEFWSVYFKCSEEEFRAFAAEMAKNGFTGGQTSSGDELEYGYVGNGYYAFLRLNPNYFGGSPSGQINITPTVFKLPTSFNGTPLPQLGAAMRSYDEWQLQYYDANYDMKAAQWDVYQDKGTIPAKNWVTWFDYFGVSTDQAKAYAKSLEASGWKIRYQNDEPAQNRYSCGLIKDKNHMIVMFDGAYFMRVGFSDMEEHLSY